MAVYKVIQDIEAEDRLLGPLTLKGFVYAAIAVLLGFINFRLLVSEAIGPLKWIFILIFFFPMVLFAVLASPLGREQPTEVWLLARIRFLLKPRERLWNQLGLIQLVKVTAPKKEELHLTKEFDATEAKSRLQALAQTLDSHGWAIKNVAVNLTASPNYLAASTEGSDRLVDRQDVFVTPPSEAEVDVRMADDILDADNNPTAQKFNDMMHEAEETRKMELQLKLEGARHAELITDKSKPDNKTDDTEQLLKEMHQRARVYSSQGGSSGDAQEMTPEEQTVKMELAQSGNAFSVATIARLANRGGSEVVVPLH